MTIVFYRDTEGQYRWRARRDGNHRTLADSAEGYKRKTDCERTAFFLFGDAKAVYEW